jgi:hypothetical protein
VVAPNSKPWTSSRQMQTIVRGPLSTEPTFYSAKKRFKSPGVPLQIPEGLPNVLSSLTSMGSSRIVISGDKELLVYANLMGTHNAFPR